MNAFNLQCKIVRISIEEKLFKIDCYETFHLLIACDNLPTSLQQSLLNALC